MSGFKHRAVFYESHGDPSSVLSVVTLPDLSPPSASDVTVKVLLAPINPADVHSIQGAYALKPSPTKHDGKSIYIPGNEGLAEVQAVGPNVKGLSKGDWVIFAKLQAGTWSSGMNINEEDVIKVKKVDGLTDTQAATMTVNPATAYNMLTGFVDLQPGDWVLQNGGNSAVGLAVIQIAASRGLKTLNLIRNRKDLDDTKEYLKGLGATEVLTYDDLDDESVAQHITEWTGGKGILLMLNCVGDETTTKMLRYLGDDAQVVTYGSISKQPLQIPPGTLIFKDLVFRGFWQSRWYKVKSREERLKLSDELVKLISQGKLKEGANEVVSIDASDDDATASKKVQDILRKVSDGTNGKKILLSIE